MRIERRGQGKEEGRREKRRGKMKIDYGERGMR